MPEIAETLGLRRCVYSRSAPPCGATTHRIPHRRTGNGPEVSPDPVATLAAGPRLDLTVSFRRSSKSKLNQVLQVRFEDPGAPAPVESRLRPPASFKGYRRRGEVQRVGEPVTHGKEIEAKQQKKSAKKEKK